MADPFFAELRDGFAEVPHEKYGRSTNIFYRFVDKKLPSTPAFSGISAENIKIVEQVMTGSRGASSFQLFLTLHISPGDSNRYELSAVRAEVDSKIWINPRTYFETLADFAEIHADFDGRKGKDGGTKSKSRSAAMRYLSNHSGEKMPDGTMIGPHWSTSFTGIRAKTMRHELDHVAFAIESCDAYVSNFIELARTKGKSPGDWPAEDRVEALMEQFMGRGFPYYDIGGADHKEIAIRDFFFMVGWYEQFHLGLTEKSNAGYDAVVAAMTNYRLKTAMQKLGEAYPWV